METILTNQLVIMRSLLMLAKNEDIIKHEDVILMLRKQIEVTNARIIALQ